MTIRKVCIIGASGKLGQYMIDHALRQGWQVNGVCRKRSVSKLERFRGLIKIFAGYTNDEEVVKQAVEGCDAVFTVLVPWGINHYASGTAKAVLDHAPAHARLIFSCGWHISMDGRDQYSFSLKCQVALIGSIAKWLRLVDLGDQVRACDLIFNSDRLWTVVRGSDLEEGESQGLPIWREHVGDKALAKNLTRRVDFALFMIKAALDSELIRKAPAIVAAS